MKQQGIFGDGKTVVIVMLFLAGVINYLDRSALSIAPPFIQEDIHLTSTQLGLSLVASLLGMPF